MNLFHKLKNGKKSEIALEHSKSMFQAISEAIQQDGCLPEDFSLPKSPNLGTQVSFADGALDGITAYHMAHSAKSPEPLARIIQMIQGGKQSAAEESLKELFTDHITMLSMIDEMQEWIIEHKMEIEPGCLFAFSKKLLKESENIESIKFGMAVLELLNTEHDEELCSTIFTLALSDEFTLFSLFLIEKWSESNQVVFDIARKVKGWGRIHAIERLQPDTEEIRQWLLLDGWKNNIMVEYSALSCAEKSDLACLLERGSMTVEQFRGAGAIVKALLAEGPVSGISAIEDAHQLLLAYVKEAESQQLGADECSTITDIREYAKAQDWGDLTAFLAFCERLLDSEGYTAEGHKDEI